MTLQTMLIFIVVIIIACKRKDRVSRGRSNTTTSEREDLVDPEDKAIAAHGCGREEEKNIAI